MSLKLIYLSIVIGISVSVDQVTSDYDIYKYPMEMDPGNWIIKAILTDESRGQVFKLEESISSGKVIRGKIITKSNGYDERIYYSSEYPAERYAIDNDDTSRCWKLTFTTEWNLRLAQTQINLVSYFLIAGPSIVFRLKNQPIQWNQTADVKVRGVSHHVYESLLTPEIAIKYYYKASKGDFETSFPSSVLFKGSSNVRMDIYSVKKVDQHLDSFVTLTEKFCDSFLTKGLDYNESPIPKVETQYKHYVAIETISSDKNQLIQKEVFSDEKFQMVDIKTTIKFHVNQIEKKTEKVYDYTLGLVYELNHEDGQRKCQMSPMDSSAPGLIIDKTNPSFSLNQQFDLNGQYYYMGPVNYMNLFNTQSKVEGWQANIKNGKIDDINYDLVIATQYILPQTVTNDVKDTVMIGTTFDGYAKTDGKRSIRKKIDYQIISTELDDSKDKFRIVDCYPDPESRKTLELRFSCKDENCGHFTRNHHKQFTIKLKESIFGMETITISRVSDIKLTFKLYETIAQITVLESPDIMDSFEHKEIRIAEKSKPMTSYYGIKNHRECLISSANIADRFEAIAYCEGKEENICGHFRKFSDIIEDKFSGTFCKVTAIPLQNIHRYSRELPLADLPEKLLLNGISFKLSDGSITSEYKVYQVNDISIKETEIEPFYRKVVTSSKLVDNSDSVTRIESVPDFGSCYQLCSHSSDVDCRSFSYCKYLDRSECLIANSPISSENTINDTYCSTNEINLLKRFDKIESRKFIKSTSIPTDNDPENCAQRCSDFDECKSFQYCSDSGSCTLEGYYTDSSTDFHPNCDIYIPKVIDKFRMTGKQIISDTFHTELSVTVDQCAALCYDWSDGKGSKSCLSFNFCSTDGKTSSICHLSRYDFDDVSREKSGKVELIHEDNCLNYNRIKKKTQSGTINDSVVLRSSFNLSGSLFIVFLFIISGLIIGFVVNTIYAKVIKRKSADKSISSTFNRNTFSWTRQLNDERQSTLRQSTITVQENDETDSV
ncbi:uncharacterized protein LOC128389347 [Panonychus citri]|uniref:uncharacterized protein LOC128389347 n=1 Tax=Panonychus citri TaxID=50023 RepID=UPI0023078F3F|nr:uncharacterized protein LOC128389347 [Panonychus citri]